MPFSSGASRWWVAAYLAVTLVCTTGWLILSQRLAEQTGLRRQVWLANDFQGPPVINDVAREPALDFLVNDPRLPREFISARWHGYWYLPSSRSFTLHVEADDYADIWIDGEQRFARSSAAERAVRLDAGVHEAADCLPTVRWHRQSRVHRRIRGCVPATAPNRLSVSRSTGTEPAAVGGYCRRTEPHRRHPLGCGCVGRRGLLHPGSAYPLGKTENKDRHRRSARTAVRGPRGSLRLALGHLRPTGHRRLDELHRCRPQPVRRRGAGSERRRFQSGHVLGAGLLAALPGQDARPATTPATPC